LIEAVKLVCDVQMASPMTSLRTDNSIIRHPRRRSARWLSLLPVAASMLFAAAGPGHAGTRTRVVNRRHTHIAKPAAPSGDQVTAGALGSTRGGKSEHGIQATHVRALRQLAEDEQARLGMEGRPPKVLGSRTIEEPDGWTRNEELLFTSRGLRRLGYRSAMKPGDHRRRETDVPVAPDTIEAVLTRGPAFVDRDGNPIGVDSLERSVDANELRSIAARRTGLAQAIGAFNARGTTYPGLRGRPNEVGRRTITGNDGQGSRWWSRNELLVVSPRGLEVIVSVTRIVKGKPVERPSYTRPATADLATTGPEFLTREISRGGVPITAKDLQATEHRSWSQDLYAL
jgi:hypothetical protein